MRHGILLACMLKLSISSLAVSQTADNRPPKVKVSPVLGQKTSQSLDATAFEPAFRKRASLIIANTADQYEPPSTDIGDPEKYYWPKAIARFEKYGLKDTMANRFIKLFSKNPPFHFVLAGTSRLLYEYPDAPSIKAERLTFLQAMWRRKDSYNAWTCEGTENHINMSRTSGYLFAQAALDYPAEFPDAPAKLAMMKDWIKAWSKRIYQVGTGEWNTGIYTTYHIIGWLNVYDYAKDPEVKACARAVLDYYAAEMALHNSYGVTGGAELRGVGAGKGDHTSTSWLNWLWFGNPTKRTIKADNRGSEYIQCLHAITSDYRPPAALVALANKEGQEGFYLGSRPIYHLGQGQYSKHFLQIGKGYTLGSATIPYGGWTGTTMQVMNWKMVTPQTGREMPLEVSGNGRFYDQWDGKTRNPFTQVVQCKNIIVQITRTPVNVREIAKQVVDTVALWDKLWRRDFKLRFPDEHDRKTVINYGKPQLFKNQSYISFPKSQKLQSFGGLNNAKFWVAEVGQTYVACLPIDGKNVKIDTVAGRTVLIDNADLGKYCGFVVTTVSKQDCKSLAAFAKRYSTTVSISYADRSEDKLYINGNPQFTLYHFDAPHMQIRFDNNGETHEALVDWGFGAKEPMSMITSPPFTQPNWPSGEGGGRVASLWMSKMAYMHQREDQWPIAAGPNLTFDKSVLDVKIKDLTYQVDYSQDLPIFSNP